MEKFIRLDSRQRRQLVSMIGKPKKENYLPLVSHYKKRKAKYDKWARELIEYEDRIGKKTESYSSEAILSILVVRMSSLDGELYEYVENAITGNVINLKVKEAIELLAKNSLATNPVNPGDSL